MRKSLSFFAVASLTWPAQAGLFSQGPSKAFECVKKTVPRFDDGVTGADLVAAVVLKECEADIVVVSREVRDRYRAVSSGSDEEGYRASLSVLRDYTVRSILERRVAKQNQGNAGGESRQHREEK